MSNFFSNAISLRIAWGSIENSLESKDKGSLQYCQAMWERSPNYPPS